VLTASLILVAVSATGAVTALGDTVYPPGASTLTGRIAEDQGLTATFLHRLRVVHPVLAVLGGLLVVHLGTLLAKRRGSPGARRAGRWLAIAVVAQLVVGLVNVWLSAPGYLQILHLALALAIWLALIATALETLHAQR
jgi:heme A synthase